MPSISAAAPAAITEKNTVGNFLFIPGHDCVPILFPLADAMDVIGHIDPSDCAGILSSTAFLHLYHQWLILLTNTDEICPFHQILHLTNS